MREPGTGDMLAVMEVVPREDAYADVALLRRSLTRTRGHVTVRETLGSTVFLVGERAYKLRRHPSVGRAAASRREVELNDALAPGVALRVRAVVPGADGDGYDLAPSDDVRAIDHVVEMRRFAEADTMRTRVARGTLTVEQASAAGARVARFHRSAAVRHDGPDYRERVDRNFEALLPLIEGVIPVGERLALQRFAAAFLLEWASVLDARAAAGSVVDGHGDLRATHVLFEPAGVSVVGRLESDSLRVVDVADELGLLLMELAELSGGQATGDAVLAGYQQAGGAAPPDALLAFFGASRAQVRATAALVQGSQPGVDARAQRAHAQRLLGLSRRLGWRARGPLLVVVTGPPAAGASTLAIALGRASGLPVLSVDTIRRERGGAHVRPAEAYAELARRAGRERAVIVHAHFGEALLERAFVEQLPGGTGDISLVVECRTPADESGERFGPRDGVAADAHLAVDTRASVSMQVDEVASWLDSLLAAGRSG